ncbi:MAG TPA: hypothetical protein DCM64_07120 [Gammaproteobacteria bacterium]|jgi:hypothetical protein|nr:hypothetical protein [Gammaproteobacteria bacterium]MDP6731227.1 hypothetical protein [Gammaproteobacteria bacterium]HAJ76211.1 hypothetical protein [Gammaproteobacteria bacterium]|tara:strand:+ start:3179 stop:3538 length:360 start_codon:yes stop_codon:yes gene_type:complete
MNEIETFEALQAVQANIISNFLGFVSLVTAYLVMAYLVGSKLTKSQLLIVNALYFVVAYFLIVGQYQFISSANYLANIVVLANLNWPGEVWEYGTWAAVVVWTFIVAGTIKFMSDVRKN